MSQTRTRGKAARPVYRDVPFETHARAAREIIITGDFTGWTDEGIRLQKTEDGRWQALLHLAPGEYQYRLRIDGQWRDHPEALAKVPNPFGSQNSVLRVR
jgi:1,4-alpha-glucan branching enzyme